MSITKRSKHLVVKFIILALVIILILIMTYFLSTNLEVKSFSMNLMTEVLGFIITIAIFEKILREYNEISELKKSKIVAIQFNKVLQEHINIYADIYKGTSINEDAPKLISLSSFFDNKYFEELYKFDWDKKSPAIYGMDYNNEKGFIEQSMRWTEYLEMKFGELETKYDSYFEKYSAWMSDAMLINYTSIIDIKLSKSISSSQEHENSTIKLASQMGAPQPLKMRFSFACGYGSYKLIKHIKEIDQYNRKNFPEIKQLSINNNLWTNGCAPSIGSSRIKEELEHLYMPKLPISYEEMSAKLAES